MNLVGRNFGGGRARCTQASDPAQASRACSTHAARAAAVVGRAAAAAGCWRTEEPPHHCSACSAAVCRGRASLASSRSLAGETIATFVRLGALCSEQNYTALRHDRDWEIATAACGRMDAPQRRGTSGQRPLASPAVPSRRPPSARRCAQAQRQARAPPPVAVATACELQDPRKGSGRRLRSPRPLRGSPSPSASPTRRVEGIGRATLTEAPAVASRTASSVRLNLPWVYTIALAVVTVAGKAGDALAPALLGSQPLLLLALNANDVHLALTSTTVPVVAWTVVGMIRRLAEDPVRLFTTLARLHASVLQLKMRADACRYSS